MSASRPARGAWIETGVKLGAVLAVERRAPRGARGLKHGSAVASAAVTRRAPRGARGLKPGIPGRASCIGSRAPRGARGLKQYPGMSYVESEIVAPRAGRVD